MMDVVDPNDHATLVTLEHGPASRPVLVVSAGFVELASFSVKELE